MNEEEIKKWERHIAKPMEFVFEDEEGNKDKFLLKPLTIEDMGDLYYVSTASVELSKGNRQDLNEMTERASKLILKTLRLSYPDIPEETLEGFAKSHFAELTNAIFQVNRFISKTAKVVEKIAEVRRNIEAKKE